MAIPPVQIPNLNLVSISDEDKAVLDAIILVLVNALNDLIAVVNTNHP